MDEVERKIRRKLRDDFPHYSSKCLKMRTREGALLPFTLNKAQKILHDIAEKQLREIGRVRIIIVKGRQLGCSTYIEGRFYWRVTHRFGVRAFILTHDNEATNNLFEMANRYHEHCPTIVRPSIDASNAKELIFGRLDSGYKVGTAGNKAVGRSSTIQYLHGSEVAYWPNASEHAKGILQAVPNAAGTEIFLESTACGTGNYFHEQYQQAEAGLTDYIPVFLPWYWDKEYIRTIPMDFSPNDEEFHLKEIYGLTNAQLMWRRYKINELSVGGTDGHTAFMQEYPCSAREAFIFSGDNAFIPPILVERARKAKMEPTGRLIIGIDSAVMGNDRTAIIRRRGRHAYGLKTYIKKTPTEMANIIHNIIKDECPDMVVLDGAAAGGGAEIRDRLYDLNSDYRKFVHSVLGGNEPIDKKKYYNKRAEMWALTKDWLIDQPVEIPDSDELEADLCNILLLRNDPLDRIKLERKEDMKKRGIRSPDCADALSLTFAFPEKAFVDDRKKDYEAIAKNVMSGFANIDRLKKTAYK